MRLLFTGGGTAGHVNPAIAVAKYIEERYPDVEIRFAGAKGGIEEKLVTREGFKLYTFSIRGLSRSLSPTGIWNNLKAVSNVLKSVSQAKGELGAWRPDIVVGTGGYASFPMVYAAAKMGIKTAMLEVNAYPGVAVKYLASMVDSVMVSFKETIPQIKGARHTVFTGGPVRADLLRPPATDVKMEMFGNHKPLVVSFWGSVGAQYMNEKMCDFMVECGKEGLFNHLHAAGSANFKWMPEMVKAKGLDLESCQNVRLVEYIFDMGEKIQGADIVVCRGGASSLAEVCCAKRGSVIVPSPYVTDNHQEKNARVIENAGGGVVVLEKDATGQNLYSTVKSIVLDYEKLAEMGKAAGALAVTNGAEQITNEIFRLIGR